MPAPGPDRDLLRRLLPQRLPVCPEEAPEMRHRASAVPQVRNDLADHPAVRGEEHPVKPDSENAVPDAAGKHGRGIVRERERDRPAEAFLEGPPEGMPGRREGQRQLHVRGVGFHGAAVDSTVKRPGGANVFFLGLTALSGMTIRENGRMLIEKRQENLTLKTL